MIIGESPGRVDSRDSREILPLRMTFSGCSAATRLLERCFISLYFKMYNVFPPMNVSALKYNIFPTLWYIWFGQNITGSIYSTLLKFPSRLSLGELYSSIHGIYGNPKTNFCYDFSYQVNVRVRFGDPLTRTRS